MTDVIQNPEEEKKECHVEVISWRDACDFKGPKDMVIKSKCPLVRTRGSVVYEDDQVVKLCHHETVPESDAFQCEEDIEGIAIPKGWIVERKILKEV